MISDFRMQDYAAHCLRERNAEYAKMEAARLAQFQAFLQEMANNGEISQKAKDRVLSFQSDEKLPQ